MNSKEPGPWAASGRWCLLAESDTLWIHLLFLLPDLWGGWGSYQLEGWPSMEVSLSEDGLSPWDKHIGKPVLKMVAVIQVLCWDL